MEEKERLQEYAVGKFVTIISRKGIKKAIKKGLVFINSKKGHTGDWVRGGETIELYRDAQSKKPIVPLQLEVLYEDQYLAIINKPAGILVSGNKRFTIENALPFNLKSSSLKDALQRPEPIHRLDYPTTGTLLIGKTAKMVIQLNQLFKNREISKTYHAISIRKMSDQGRITHKIDEKDSLSEYKNIATIISEKYQYFNFLELTLHTGRRHQLRKHLHSIGNPILGDSQYKNEGMLLKGKGLYLHASSLRFKHPEFTTDIEVYAPFPKKFIKLFPEEVSAIGFSKINPDYGLELCDEV